MADYGKVALSKMKKTEEDIQGVTAQLADKANKTEVSNVMVKLDEKATIAELNKQTNKIKNMSATGSQLEFNSKTIPYAMKAEDWEFTANSGSISESPEGLILSRSSSNTAGTFLNATLDMPCDLRNKNIVLKLRADANVRQITFYWYATSRTTLKFREGIAVGSGIEDVKSRDTVISLNPLFLGKENGTQEDLKDFRRLGINVYLADGASSCNLIIKDLKVVDAIPAPGVVALVFDDAWKSHYTKAFQKMRQYNMTGSIGVITGFVDNNSEYCTTNELNEIYANGWDLNSHTVNHLQLGSLSGSALRSELIDSQQWLANKGFTRSHRHLIYPGLSYSDEALKEVKKFYLSARATNAFKTGYPMCEKHHYGHYVYIKRTTTVQQVKDAIDRTKQFGGICMITFHDILDVLGSDSTGKFLYDYKTSDFNEIIDYIYQSEMPTATISELFEGGIPDMYLN